MQYLTKMVLTLSLFFGIHFVYANEIYDKNERGVVLIMGDNGFGSGVILSQKGYVLTNSHVISDNPNLKVLLNYNYPLDNIEDYSHDVIILKQDQSKDLALLKIKNPKTLLHTVKVSKKIPNIGDKVHAIGHPQSAIWTYTVGYISQIREDFEWTYEDGIERIANVYQTQTPIDEGKSGGPLLNSYGNLIGINTFKNEETSFHNFSLSVDEIISFLSK